MFSEFSVLLQEKQLPRGPRLEHSGGVCIRHGASAKQQPAMAMQQQRSGGCSIFSMYKARSKGLMQVYALIIFPAFGPEYKKSTAELQSYLHIKVFGRRRDNLSLWFDGWEWEKLLSRTALPP